jgi:hypothetical protein
MLRCPIIPMHFFQFCHCSTSWFICRACNWLAALPRLRGVLCDYLSCFVWLIRSYTQSISCLRERGDPHISRQQLITSMLDSAHGRPTESTKSISDSISFFVYFIVHLLVYLISPLYNAVSVPQLLTPHFKGYYFLYTESAENTQDNHSILTTPKQICHNKNVTIKKVILSLSGYIVDTNKMVDKKMGIDIIIKSKVNRLVDRPGGP